MKGTSYLEATMTDLPYGQLRSEIDSNLAETLPLQEGEITGSKAKEN